LQAGNFTIDADGGPAQVAEVKEEKVIKHAELDPDID
jgi:hypothetical protein